MLVFVRHGRTTANREGRLQGRIDLPLDELGERQAAAVAAHVRAGEDGLGLSIDRVIASPLQRAQQTVAAFGLPIETDERWIELSYGEYEGVAHADVPSEVWNQWFTDRDFVPDGGESLATLDARVRGACDDLRASARHETIVVVSHVSPMKSAVAWALGVDIGISWRCHLDQASICRVAVRGDRPVLTMFNETVGVS
ncbi:MAG: histidine phosphatase family protein [Actinomycetota bacterium]